MSRQIEKFRISFNSKYFPDDEWFAGEVVCNATLPDFESYLSTRSVMRNKRVDGGLTGSATGYIAQIDHEGSHYTISFLVFDGGRSVFGIKSSELGANVDEKTIVHLMNEFLELTESQEIEGEDLTELYRDMREKHNVESYIEVPERVGVWRELH